ncbi:DoxX family membrane protein [Streptomyces sp. ODS28]|uniref:DoxX family protein n=1 Tax=Streptomyces sp. ODS28 TaxID=3136688 RepID=UPI0031EE8592
MRIFSLAARPLTGAVFIISGYDVLQNPGPAAELAAPTLRRLRDKVPALPEDDTVSVRANAAVQLAAGCMLALGKAPRLSALALAASLAPTTFAGHAWWEQEDPVMRAQHKTQFLKNASIMGGLLGVLGDARGRPSLAWRTKHALNGKSALPGRSRCRWSPRG